MSNKKIMEKWDYWRKQIADGNKSSSPRDWFESVLDNRDEQIKMKKERAGQINRIIAFLVMAAIAIAVFVSVSLYYENEIKGISAKHNIILMAWEEMTEDYVKLTNDCFDLSKKKTKQIWKLKRLLRDCENNKYHRVWSNL